MARNDEINHPDHYAKDRKHEPIDVIEEYGLNFSLGNVIKYISRAGRKEGVDELVDLKKAAWYLNREIKRRERE